MRFLRADFKRGCCEPRFLIALLLGIGCALVSGFVIAQGDLADGYAFFTKSHSLALPFIVPLLCALPYSNMVMLEKSTKFDSFMALRLNHRIWYFGRFLVNGILSGLVGLMPGVALLLASLHMDGTAFTVAVFQVLLLNFAFGFAFGSLSYGLCFVNTASYIPLVAPQVIYLFFIYAFPILGLSQYYPPLAYAPWILPSVASMPHIALFLLAVTAVSLLLTCVGAVRKAVGA